MKMSDYENAIDNLRRKDIPNTLEHLALGLAGESGETIEHIKKYRCGDGYFDREAFLLECGDVLFYLTRMINLVGSSLVEVMTKNTNKMEHLKLQGKLFR